MEPRELYQIQMDVRFSARYHELCERWWLLLNDANTFVGLILSSAVIVTVFQQVNGIAIGFACLSALLHALNLTLGSVRKAQQHRDLFKRYKELDAQMSGARHSASAADELYRVLEREDPATNEAFRRLAFEDNLRTYGHAEQADNFAKKLTWRQRALRATI